MEHIYHIRMTRLTEPKTLVHVNKHSSRLLSQRPIEDDIEETVHERVATEQPHGAEAEDGVNSVATNGIAQQSKCHKRKCEHN